MNCNHVKSMSSDALDGVLQAAQAETFFAHLESCPPCRVFHEEMRQAVALLSSFPEVDALDGFEDKVWTRIALEHRKSSRAPRWVRAVNEIRERISFASARPGWVATWSFAGVAASLVAVALISSDPAPRASVARVDASSQSVDVASSSPGQQAATSQVSSVAYTSSTSEASSSEDEFVAEMPEAVRVFLDNAKDLRLPVGAERYRRANYSYPVRRVEVPSPFHMAGESSSPSLTPSSGATDEESTVISF